MYSTSAFTPASGMALYRLARMPPTERWPFRPSSPAALAPFRNSASSDSFGSVNTAFIREREPDGVTVSVGGEIGEVGHKNSTVEELHAFMEGYNATLGRLGRYAGLSKISVQTGTSHGGVVLPDGSIADVKLDLEALAALSKAARETYHLGGAVQHGASTLPQDAFGNFPRVETAEIHLATNFQNIIFDHPRLPAALRDEMKAWLVENAQSERKAGDSEEQFYYKARKRAIGPSGRIGSMSSIRVLPSST